LLESQENDFEIFCAGDDNEEKTPGPAALELDEENMPLMKENEHIPNIKEQLMEEKIANILTASVCIGTHFCYSLF
jgi:hypothetical protein